MSTAKIQTIDTANTAVQEIAREYMGNSAIMTPELHEVTLDKSREALSNRIREATTIQNLTSIISKAEDCANLAIGVVTIRPEQPEQAIAYVGAPAGTQSSVVIRDGRAQKKLSRLASSFEDTYESYLMIAASQARGALKMIELSSEGNKEEAKEEVLKVFQAYANKIQTAASPDLRGSLIQKMNNEIGYSLQHNGLIINGTELSQLSRDKLADTMGVTRDLANYEEKTHPAKITISSEISSKEGSSLYHVTGFVPTISTDPPIRAIKFSTLGYCWKVDNTNSKSIDYK